MGDLIKSNESWGDPSSPGAVKIATEMRAAMQLPDNSAKLACLQAIAVCRSGRAISHSTQH